MPDLGGPPVTRDAEDDGWWMSKQAAAEDEYTGRMQADAHRYKRERDEARAEADRLRALAVRLRDALTDAQPFGVGAANLLADPEVMAL